MLIKESRLKKIIREMVEEDKINEMMDMMHYGSRHEAGYSGTVDNVLENLLNKKVAYYGSLENREREKRIREVLTKLHIGSELVTQCTILLGPLCAAAYAHGNDVVGNITLGMFILAFLSDEMIKRKLGKNIKDIHGVDQKIKVYLHKSKVGKDVIDVQSVEEFIEKELDREGFVKKNKELEESFDLGYRMGYIKGKRRAR